MKRLLAFLLLLGLGVLALQLAIGDERAVPASAASAEPPQRQPDAPAAGGIGIDLQQGKVSASVTHHGKFSKPHYRSIEQPDGSKRRELVYLLSAEKSQPVPDAQSLQQLDQVRIDLYERGAPAAVLEARQAFVTMGNDANGRPAPDEDKDIDLRDAVLFTLPDSRLPGLRLELGDARVMIEAESVLLTTAPTQPVRLTLDGERRATLRGFGTQARLPRGNGGAMRRADVEILRDPVLETEGAVVRAKGRLHYREDLDSGAARITLDDDVQLDLQRSDLSLPGLASSVRGDSGRITVRGDQFNGWLCRSSNPGAADGERDSSRQQLAWRQLELTGAPATIDVDGGKLQTPRVTARPGLFGELLVLTAHGGASRFEQTAVRENSKQKFPVIGQAQRRLHVIRPGEGPGALHRAFGFPRWTLRPLADLQVVVGDGAARVDSGPSHLEAGNGIRIARRDGTEHAIVHGLGPVHVQQQGGVDAPDLAADGSDGCTLLQNDDGQRLELGPPGPGQPGHDDARWRAHRYDVRHGTAHLTGHGTCRLEHDAGRSDLLLLDPAGQLRAELPQQQLQLDGVRRLVAVITKDQVQGLDLAGWPLEVKWTSGTDSLTARSPRLLQTGPGSLQLLPVPADAEPGLWRELTSDDRQPHLAYEGGRPGAAKRHRVDMRGPRIDLHHLGGRAAMIDARSAADQRPTLRGTVPQPERTEPMQLTCEADRIRLLPFLMTPEVRWWHGGRASGPGLANGLSGATPWLLVDEVRRFTLDDQEHGHVEGTAHRLLVAQGAGAALFVGDAERSTPAEVVHVRDGREQTMRGARVRLRSEYAPRSKGPANAPTERVTHLLALGTFDDRSVFLPPTLVLREPGKDGLLSHMQARCRGNIEVRPEAVLFGGPVIAQALADDGSPDPTGLRIDAQELQMTRNGGDIGVVTGREVTLDWPRLTARTAELELDLPRHRLIARDRNWARVVLASGLEFQSPFIEVDYETMAVQTHRGRGRQRTVVQDGPR
ncbi:MAG: hypothetical protein MUC36_07725 [Planctomycetes bacterium]|jgi:hypothetical protein|nr:hypothetical protein [Planctomycetota bacterium]